MKNRILGLASACALVAVACMLAFAPPGVTFSKQSYIYGPVSGDMSSYSSALDAAGSGGAADSLTLSATNPATGRNVFDVHETTGLELHFALTGALNTTATARVFRAIPVTSSQLSTDPVQWTYRHICDVSLTASAQTGTGSGITKGTQRWASIVVTADAGAMASTRVVNGTTTNAAGSLFIDPVCAPRIVVQTRVGTATDVTVFASDWTRN